MNNNMFFSSMKIFSNLCLAAGGIFQNSVYGMAAKLPFKYTGAVVLGSNISGTFTSVVFILSKLYTSSERTAAIYYFIGAIFVLLACFDTYFALPLNVSHLKLFTTQSTQKYTQLHTIRMWKKREMCSISSNYIMNICCLCAENHGFSRRERL